MDQQIQHRHINGCYSKHCCHGDTTADAETQQRSHIPHLTLGGGLLLSPCHPGQRILLALSRIPLHEEKALGQGKVLQINPFETKRRITYVVFVARSFATVQQQLEVTRELCVYTYIVQETMELLVPLRKTISLLLKAFHLIGYNEM